MTPCFNIRRCESADHDRVVQLHEKAMRDVGAFDDGQTDSDLDTIQETYLQNRGEFLVGTLDTKIIAMGAFRPATEYMSEFLADIDASTATIKRMRVAPSFQRRGYGRQILNELERRACERGFDELVLDTTETQHGSQRFYETHGFVEEHRETISMSEKTFELVFYRKSLQEERIR